MTVSSNRARTTSAGRKYSTREDLKNAIQNFQAQIDALWGPVAFDPHDKRFETRTAFAAAVIDGAGTSIKSVATDGYGAPGDGGGRLYRFVESEPAHPGKMQSEDGAWWELVPSNGRVNVLALGAKLDGTTDDATALTNAVAAAIALDAEVYAPPDRTMYLGSAVDAKGLRFANIRATIEVDPAIAGVALTFGEVSGFFDLRLGHATNGVSVSTGAIPSDPIVRFVGLKTGRVEIGDCNYVQFYADGATSIRRAFAYNAVHFNGVLRFVELTDSGDGTTGVPWVNENTFYGGRLYGLHIKGDHYTHDHNYFFRPTLEGSGVELVFNNTVSNIVYGARFESVSSGSISFDADASHNMIFSTHSKSGSTRKQFQAPDIPITDKGKGNIVTTDAATRFTKTLVWAVGPQTLIVGGASDSAAQDNAVNPRGFGHLSNKCRLVPGLRGVDVLNAHRWVALSDMMPVKFGDVVSFDADWDGSLGRLAIYVWDAKMQPLTSEGGDGAYISMPGLALDTHEGYGYYIHHRNQTASYFSGLAAAVARREVGFIRVGLFLGTAGFIRGAACSLHTQTLGRQLSEASRGQNIAIALEGIPTRGYLPEGTMIYNHDSANWHRCSYAHETILDGALSGGATSVRVQDIDTVANSDRVGILLDDGTTHWSGVSGLAGSTFTVDPLPSAAEDTNRVVFNRWTT